MIALKQKILLLLLGGIAFGYSYTAHKQWKVIRGVSSEWKKINERELYKEIKNLYRSKSVERKSNSDGSYTFILTEKGRLRALTYNFESMAIKSKEWDGKWRFIIFDIPEKLKKGRDALRQKIKKLGFFELQKSVFVFPYECKNETEFIIEFFDIRKYVRYGTIDSIDNDLHLRKVFGLR